MVGGLDSVRGPYVEPVVLVDVPAEEPAVTEETFGPTVVISRVADLDEAVEAANSGSYGLGASVFSRRHGRALARRLKAGMVSINSVLTYASVPGLPWGGSGDSGFGRIHGPDGLREFARSRAVTVQLFDIPLKIATFARPDSSIGQLQPAGPAALGSALSRRPAGRLRCPLARPGYRTSGRPTSIGGLPGGPNRRDRRTGAQLKGGSMARTFSRVGVVGLGTMGAGIVEVFARNGLSRGRGGP